MEPSNLPQASGYYFISYSRQEVTFVDSLSRELQKNGVRNWVDFRNLVPGRPWQPQLDEGVGKAEAILLVVSKASMSSRPVKDEWTKSLAAGKRIILIVFEPCKVDAGLAGLEWVDFTGDFNTAMKHLLALLPQSKQEMKTTPPQQGLRLPAAAKRFSALSIFAAILAIIGTIMTVSIVSGVQLQEIYAGQTEANQIRDLIVNGLVISVILLWIPAIWNFLQIPARITNRTHNAENLRNAVNGLRFANLFLLLFPFTQLMGFWEGVELGVLVGNVLFLSVPLMLIIFIVCAALDRLIGSEPMYRWAGPTGVIVRAIRPETKGQAKPQNQKKVAIEHAPQDRSYALELKSAIQKAGHTYTENLNEADVVLVLLSVFKSKSVCDPEAIQVIPVLLQKCEVDPSFSKVQWVDLRFGKASIDAVANLIDKPEELLRVLGVLPIRTTILPDGIKRLTGALAVFLPISLMFGLFSFPGLLAAAGIFFLRRFLINRRLKFLPFSSYWLILGWAALIVVLAMSSKWEPAEVAFLTLVIPLLTLPKEVRMWVPSGR